MISSPTVSSTVSLSSRSLPSLEEVQTAPLAELVDLGNFLRERSSAATRFPTLDFSDSALSRSKDLQQVLEKRVSEESRLVHAHASYLLKASLLLPQSPHFDDLLESLCVRHDVCSRYGAPESSAIAHYRQNHRSYQILSDRILASTDFGAPVASVAPVISATRVAPVARGTKVQVPRDSKVAIGAKGTTATKGTPYHAQQALVQQLSSLQEKDGLGSMHGSSDSLLTTLIELGIYLSSAAAATQLVYRLILRG